MEALASALQEQSSLQSGVTEAHFRLLLGALEDCERELAASKTNSSNCYSELSTSVQTLANAQTKFIAAHLEFRASVSDCSALLETLKEHLEQSAQRERMRNEECERYRTEALQAQEKWQQLRLECDVIMREFGAIRREVLELKSRLASREVQSNRW